MRTKSGIMMGLGEERRSHTNDDRTSANAGCDVGQHLAISYNLQKNI